MTSGRFTLLLSKHLIPTAALWTSSALAQTLYVPGGTVGSTSSNVGVGTNAPSRTLDINGTLGFAGNATLPSGGTPVFANVANFGLQLSSFKFGVATNAATTPNFIVDNTGSVGIGTTSPQAKLHLQGSNMNTSVLVDSQSAGLGDSSLRLVRNGVNVEELRVIAAGALRRGHDLTPDSLCRVNSAVPYGTQATTGLRGSEGGTKGQALWFARVTDSSAATCSRRRQTPRNNRFDSEPRRQSPSARA